MSEVLITVAVLAILLAWVYSMRHQAFDFQRQRAEWEQERTAWGVERQQLLDRIQAPSFSEMKHAEVKVIKAQQGIKEPPPLEIL